MSFHTKRMMSFGFTGVATLTFTPAYDFADLVCENMLLLRSSHSDAFR